MTTPANQSARPTAGAGFSHPADSWYQIEAPGEHPNTRAGVVQVIDNKAVDSIVAAFNREADTQPNFAGMLIDHEHFKHDEDKETRAFGWLMRLRNRGGILEGQIRWTGTGRQAVDTGDYRFFSTEYDLKDMEVLSSSKPRRVRPLRLDGLTLTNVPNNKGARPITNRILNRQQYNPQPDMNTILEDSPAANSATARALAENMAATTGQSFEHCWNSVRSARPDLFGLETREEADAEQQRQPAARAEQYAPRNRAPGLARASVFNRHTRTLTERYHFGQHYDDEAETTIVNRADAKPFEIHDLVVEFQRENNLHSFSAAWDRAIVRHPEWFFATA
jgi:phage I-like protein